MKVDKIKETYRIDGENMKIEIRYMANGKVNLIEIHPHPDTKGNEITIKLTPTQYRVVKNLLEDELEVDV